MCDCEELKAKVHGLEMVLGIVAGIAKIRDPESIETAISGLSQRHHELGIAVQMPGVGGATRPALAYALFILGVDVADTAEIRRSKGVSQA